MNLCLYVSCCPGIKMMNISLEKISKNEWNSVILGNPDSRFYQLREYAEVLEEVFGLKRRELVMRDESGIIGVMPLFVVKTLLFRKIVSIPFAEYGGIVSNVPEKIDFNALQACLSDITHIEGVDHIEINGGRCVREEIMSNIFPSRSFHHIAELEITNEHLLWEGFDRQVKKAIRKAEKVGVRTFEDNGEKMLTDHFYPLYLKASRRLGSPPLSIGYFQSCRKHFGDSMKMFYAELDGKIVSALLGYVTGDRVYAQVVVSDDTAHDSRSVDLVHWAFMKWSAGNGIRVFDLGPVRYEGQMKYKIKWGCKLIVYKMFYYQKNGIAGKDLPIPLTPLSPEIGFLKKLWVLQPAFMQNKIGPWVRYNLAK